MPDATSYPWTGLSDFGRATTWCNSLPVERLEKLSLQSLLLMVSSVCEEGFGLVQHGWDPDTGSVPKKAQQAFSDSLKCCHDALLLSASFAHRTSPDCVYPPPSRALSVATLASRLNASEAHQTIPCDLASALFELETTRQMAMAEHFTPQARLHRNQRHLTAPTLEALLVSVGTVLICLEEGKPWVILG